jgi:hypothetical protein
MAAMSWAERRVANPCRAPHRHVGLPGDIERWSTGANRLAAAAAGADPRRGAGGRRP